VPGPVQAGIAAINRGNPKTLNISRTPALFVQQTNNRLFQPPSCPNTSSRFLSNQEDRAISLHIADSSTLQNIPFGVGGAENFGASNGLPSFSGRPTSCKVSQMFDCPWAVGVHLLGCRRRPIFPCHPGHHWKEISESSNVRDQHGSPTGLLLDAGGTNGRAGPGLEFRL